MFQLMMPAQLFDVLSQLTKVNLGLSIGTPIVTFNVVGTFNPTTLNIRRHIHPHSITVGTSTTLNLRRHIHPHSISVGTYIQTQSLSAHPLTFNIRRHIHPHSIAFGTSVHPHSFSVGTSIHAKSPSAHPFTLNIGRHNNHLSVHSIPVGKSICYQSQFDAEYRSKKFSRALRANSQIPHYT